MGLSIRDYLNPLDVDALSGAYRSARPFPYFSVDALLKPEFLAQVVAAYPSYPEALELGREFGAANERLKIQITDPRHFPEPVGLLHQVLSSDEFVGLISKVTGICDLVVDPTLAGAGMHVMGSGGRLDVHVDFNRLKEQSLYRRLNILLFLNERWETGWGGLLELWDEKVKRCEHAFVPQANRCVVFETSERSFHGVTPLSGPDGITRNSYAGYYYTATAPADAPDRDHTTIFRPRPGERVRWLLRVPAERVARSLPNALRSAKRAVLGRGR